VNLWPDEMDLPIVDYDSAVVSKSLVVHWHSKVTDNIVSVSLRYNFTKDVPRMSNSVHLQKVVLSSIPRNFQFRANPQRSPQLLSLFNRLHNISLVVLEVHGPLVKVASGDLAHTHLHEIHYSEY
jgi:hypothetical protein